METTGEVIRLSRGEGRRGWWYAAPRDCGAAAEGDSVAVSGVCLTALEIRLRAERQWFAADLAEETIARTTLSRLKAGAVVNLELPTPAGAPLGGHVVQGHVDGVGTLVALDAVGRVRRRRTGCCGCGCRRRCAVCGGERIDCGGGDLADGGGDRRRRGVDCDYSAYVLRRRICIHCGGGWGEYRGGCAGEVCGEPGRAEQRSGLTVEYLLANGY